MTLRRQFDLLPQDLQFLKEYGLPWETIVDGSQWVLIHDFQTHDGYNHARLRRPSASRRVIRRPSLKWSISSRHSRGKMARPLAQRRPCSNSTASRSSAGPATELRKIREKPGAIISERMFF